MVGIQIPNEHRFWVSIIQIPAVSLQNAHVKYLDFQIHFPNRTPRQEDPDRSEDVRSQVGVEQPKAGIRTHISPRQMSSIVAGLPENLECRQLWILRGRQECRWVQDRCRHLHQRRLTHVTSYLRRQDLERNPKGT